ncbi:type II toxin-antitoxin system death-on-curing family toxin [Rhodovulum sulfidophilum]|uniref:type II toxin-antitoxin system death-on-curing family toxin n=1 Tax=Rhodovulum sulfidophilum TaxID=35806 RepID=UPI000952D8DE|nr:type II toxin-antitoxin system death-on-curing family toxin [Rhodovulum sulfidophilum]MBL3552395.1 type II toxin-antitoxin system death-on-curing family toxin [Rhodovulum sulfidophilum]MBL3574635.1 type II toxin-antitoxin system death-on-curing family toxin [Rhodovulum sulfidophilum]MCE8431547.1 type II toxin-antitoxin system death-on-curing family toxin [Rhodovulum sulfidophilum]MCF4116231.1 type II toxin-antitoxin system death-on-curing family toxin [Rhodovulum sulfidophilum]OLS49143.1 hy
MIESAISRPYSGYHRSIWRKAAALTQSMVGNHGFVDGNKRTALLLVETLIERSGYYLVLSGQDRFDDLIVGVASGEIDFDALVVWFEERVARR